MKETSCHFKDGSSEWAQLHCVGLIRGFCRPAVVSASLWCATHVDKGEVQCSEGNGRGSNLGFYVLYKPRLWKHWWIDDILSSSQVDFLTKSLIHNFAPYSLGSCCESITSTSQLGCRWFELVFIKLCLLCSHCTWARGYDETEGSDQCGWTELNELSVIIRSELVGHQLRFGWSHEEEKKD